MNELEFLYIALGVCAFLFFVVLILNYCNVPISYPIIHQDIDISGRRNPSYSECIDEWIIGLSNHRQTIIDIYNYSMGQWDKKSKDYVSRAVLWRKHKNSVYNKIRCEAIKYDYRIFEFSFYRSQTRYRQVNYQRTPYTVNNVEYVLRLSLSELLMIDDILEEIDYETTIEKYNMKNQRKLMTKELRHKIMQRDNYTCQICGKYMPDEVGLHVDHIVPIKKGGKTVESNLQVLCDKCNLRKGKR